MAERVAVITGGNKGIGLEIVRCLCRELGERGVVYLTARDEGRGHVAVDLLKSNGLSPRFHVLDVTNKQSIKKLEDHLKQMHGGLDILINNAGIGTRSSSLSMSERAQQIFPTNFFGLLDVSRALLPLVRSGGRVVNVASTTSYFVFKDLSDDLKNRFRQASGEEAVIELMNEFIQATKDDITQKGWVEWPYGTSKLGVITLTVIQARRMAEDDTRKDVLINCCCPGFVDTDLTAQIPNNRYGGRGKITIPEGAITPVFLALLPSNAGNPHGQFLLRRQVYDYINNDVEIILVPE